MTTAAWISISKRLLLDPSIEYKIPETNQYQKAINFEYDNSKKFNGILNYI